jgi:hypothetical protein
MYEVLKVKRNGEDGPIGHIRCTAILRKCPVLLKAVARFGVYEHAGETKEDMNRGVFILPTVARWRANFAVK